MKTTSTTRGLYKNVRRTPETEAEQRQLFEALAADLERYILEATRIASNTLRAEGIDPDTLFDAVKYENGCHIRFTKIDRNKLSPEADSALTILELCKYDQPGDKSQRNGVLFGIRLAQSVEHLNTNRAFLKPVDVGSRVINGNPNRKPDLTAMVEQYMDGNSCSITSARKAVAAMHDVSVRTLIRQFKRKKR